MVTLGKLPTDTVKLAVFVQPFPSVPVTVYVVVAVAVLVTGVPVVELRPVTGLHTYVDAPPAVRLIAVLLHTDTSPDVLIVGSVVIVTVTMAVSVHPAPLVPVTV